MRVLRLHPNDAASWAAWPRFEARALDFIARVSGEQVTDQFVRWLRESFVNRAEIMGAWLAFEDDVIVGHLLSWTDVFFGEPYVFVHQVETDPGATQGPLHALMVDELRHWVDAMNWAYERAGVETRIRRMRFTTHRSDRAWREYLKPLGEIEKVRSIVTVRVHPDVPAATVAPALQPPPGATTPHNGEQEA